MSRKDKYETNNRRQQTFMSPEDVAAGRKSSWQGVEITGEFKSQISMFRAIKSG
jgi:CCR4-NOT transcription complex subunit 6